MARMATSIAHPLVSADRDSTGGLVSATTLIAPSVEFFSGRQDAYIGIPGLSWRRVTAKEAAHGFTGRGRDSHEPRIGVFVAVLQGGMARLGFDLWRLDVNLTESACERLRALHAARSARWSKAELRRTRDRVHFAKTFGEFVVKREDVEEWKDELSHVLSDPGSYEAI
jgi:hypothetical protein